VTRSARTGLHPSSSVALSSKSSLIESTTIGEPSVKILRQYKAGSALYKT
jgi:hypothetical protein